MFNIPTIIINLITFMIFASCISSDEGGAMKYEIELDTHFTPSKFESTCRFKNKTPVYIVEMDEKGKEYLVKGDSLDIIKGNVNKLIEIINRRSKVKVRIVKERASSLFLRIDNSAVFTQQMGDTDANWYLACLVFSLTESGKFETINLNFKPGDHGGLPGKKSRKDFLKDYIICN